MNFGRLKEIFREHARELFKVRDPTSRFRSTSYNRVAEVIESKYPNNTVITDEKIDTLPLTPYMKKKIHEISKGRELKIVKTKSVVSRTKGVVKKDHSTKELIKKLIAIKGIGEERAKQLIIDGLKDIKELKLKKWMNKLPEESKLFLNLKPAEFIPHDDIAALEPYIKKLQSSTTKLFLVGSYRREKPFSRDIDVMVVSKNKNSLNNFLKRLSKTVTAYPYSQGDDKLSVILDMSDMLKRPAIYKLDAFRVDPENMTSMLLYSTGSKQFNIIMRGRAKKYGLLLNQNGMFKKEGKQLVKLDLPTEKDYFKILNMQYKEPKDRI